MGSLNIAEWSPDQVMDWLSGLGPTVAGYVPALRQRGLDGAKLLTLRCDDLEYLGIHVIGHQELLLEAVEHLRNFQYEVSRECVQQLALRVSGAATSLARALRHAADARLETHSLADVARTVHAVKPLVCWLDRWAGTGAALGERKAALLKLALEAATCAQRDRFAEQPARAVAAAAAAAAQLADYIIQDVSDPMILQPASLDTVTLRQGARALGFEVLPSFCGHHQLAHIRFGSPAHASGAVHDGDEIVQVGAQCVIGWSGEAVEQLCARTAAAAPAGELPLRLRRRGAARLARTPPLHAPRRARRRLPPAADLLAHRSPR
ncbi:PREDICTED: connector enhancer of kinase suppressor of ras 3-like [Papilio xuthus]|uniref:Connector enhancer of kinase suppressor of ras 3-like n=1 Tax=Papilio xuthus TaxID=66420 RepID=A0AAJ7EHK0_PAPXU|nr:PREDICTED: connector enhancer of kinase suppressor of ras 3-like [Papilio xuthus]